MYQLLRMIEETIKRSLISIISFYRRYISPFKPRTCRFYPTCSEYAILSLKKHGLFRGSVKAAWRVMRCNPFNPGGVDYP